MRSENPQPVCPTPTRDAVDEITITSPCTVPWESMHGDQRVRFCGQCHQNVYNISELSRLEAQRLIESREARVCVRILHREDGTVVTADCWTRLRAARRKGWLTFAALLLVIGWGQLWAVRFGWLTVKQLWRPACPAAMAGAMIPKAPEKTTVGTPPSIPHAMAGEIAPIAGHLRLGKRAHALRDEPLELEGLISPRRRTAAR